MNDEVVNAVVLAVTVVVLDVAAVVIVGVAAGRWLARHVVNDLVRTHRRLGGP